MPFDPLSSIFISYISNKALDKVFASLQGCELSQNLRKAARDWEKTLPEEIKIEPEVFFPKPGHDKSDQERFLYRDKLFQNLEAQEIPKKQLWFKALQEHREDRKTALKDQAHIFFRSNDTVTDKYLKDLADKFYDACSQTDSFFKKAVITAIESINGIKDIFNILGKASNPLSAHIPVLDFETLVQERTRSFVGREFLFDAVDSVINDPGFKSGYIVIKGEAGIGKSTFSAQLIKKRGYVHHFNIRVQGIQSAECFLANICAQLVVIYDLEYQELPRTARIDSCFMVRLLAEAATKVCGKPIVIVVDALDESDTSNLQPDANWLLLPQDLPDGVFFVVTTRERHEDRLCVNRRKDISLLDMDPRNLEDVLHYIKNYLAENESSMIPKIEQWGMEPDSFVTLLVEKSEGNFQYLHFVLPDIREGRLTLQNLERPEALPQGLRAYYQRHWRTMKAKDIEYYKKIQRPVLCILASAREPVSLDMLAVWTKLNGYEILDLIKKWREFLNVRRSDDGKRLYHIYHTSFVDFLEAEEGLSEFNSRIADSGENWFNLFIEGRET